MSKLEKGINVAATLIIAIGVAVLGWRVLRAAPTSEIASDVAAPVRTLSMVDAATLGQPNAPVVMVEFSDFYCAFCRRFTTQTLPRLREKYIDTGLLKAAFRHLPLQSNGPSAFAAGVAECARRHGKFWEVHDRFFSVRDLTEFDLHAAAGVIGVHRNALEACVSETADAVTRDTKQAGLLGVEATPTFFFGVEVEGILRVTDVVNGAQAPAEFERIIDRLLRRRS